MLTATFLLCLGWGLLTLFFLSLVRIGAKPEPKPHKRFALSVLTRQVPHDFALR